MSCFHVEENIFWIDLHFCYTCFTTEETYQERQCRLVKSCVTTFHPSLREEQVSTATFTSSLNRTHTSTSRRISDHCNGEQTYLIIIYRSPTLVHWKEVCTDVWSQNCFLWIVQKTLSRCLSFSHSLKARTFNTLEFYRKHQDSITPAGLAFFQSQWDESVTKTFHSTLSESINYILSWTSRISMNNMSFFVLILDPCRHEGAGLRVHQASSLPPSTGQIPSQTATALPGQIQRWKGAHIWNILMIHSYHN